MSTKAIFDNIAEHLEEQIDLAENKQNSCLFAKFMCCCFFVKNQQSNNH